TRSNARASSTGCSRAPLSFPVARGRLGVARSASALTNPARGRMVVFSILDGGNALHPRGMRRIDHQVLISDHMEGVARELEQLTGAEQEFGARGPAEFLLA